MQRIGHRAAWLIAGVVAAAVPAVWMWGFTVDDALISVRYAHNLAVGNGWRFNAGGPSTDGVTPLPWPLVLAPLARADALVVLSRAKALGLLLWGVAGGWLGARVGEVRVAPAWARASALATMALATPLAAYAVSGMETALATTLATGAVLAGGRLRVSALLAGLAASLRPEMAPWAFALAVGLGVALRAPRMRVAQAAALALAPFVLCALVRVGVWGRPAPLALLAKPSDLAHGLAYAGAGCVVAVVPLLVLAPKALRCDRVALALVIAYAVHVGAVAFAGGDWMPFFRLLAPACPSLVWAAVLVSARARRAASAVRSAVAIAAGLVLLPRACDKRHVQEDRATLVATAAPWLDDVHAVAALDVGWVSAATAANVVDLAGVTDPEVAVLRGGHTSKRVDPMFLLSRHVDALLLYTQSGLPDDDLQAWRDAVYRSVVEARLAADDVIARHFAPVAWLPLGSSGAGYVLLRAAAGE